MKTWNSVAYETVCFIADMEKLPDPKAEHKMHVVSQYISTWITEDQCNPEEEELVVGLCMLAAREALARILDSGASFNHNEMAELLARKQNDYGHQNISNFGMVGIAVRMCDKIARLHNLETRGISPENETVRDTLDDIIGYAVIAKMWQDQTFLLELETK
jgi:hypothetical protein